MEAGALGHPWVRQIRDDLRALWALSPAARKSLQSPDEPGCEKNWLRVVEDDLKWRDLVGSLHFEESTFDKRSDE